MTKWFLSNLSVLAVGMALVAPALGQQPYHLLNSNTTRLMDRSGTLLDNETPTAPLNTQGQLIQLGYFDAATDASLFAGTFRVLAQFLSGDSATGIVDIPNGRIDLTVQFDTALQATNFPGGAMMFSYPALSPYPLVGAPLAIRWYDADTTAGFYNSMSATTWDWISPTASPAPSFDLNPDAGSLPPPTGLSFEANSAPFIASIPEPTAIGYLLMVMLAGAWKVRIKK